MAVRPAAMVDFLATVEEVEAPVVVDLEVEAPVVVDLEMEAPVGLEVKSRPSKSQTLDMQC